MILHCIVIYNNVGGAMGMTTHKGVTLGHLLLFNVLILALM